MLDPRVSQVAVANKYFKKANHDNNFSLEEKRKFEMEKWRIEEHNDREDWSYVKNIFGNARQSEPAVANQSQMKWDPNASRLNKLSPRRNPSQADKEVREYLESMRHKRNSTDPAMSKLLLGNATDSQGTSDFYPN